MKKLLLSLFLLLMPVEAFAFSQAGMTPCLITAQPGDLVLGAATSGNVHLNTCGETLIVLNNGANDVRVRFGTTSATTAVVTDMLIPKATAQTFNVGSSGLWIAGFSTAGTTLSFILGTSIQ